MLAEVRDSSCHKSADGITSNKAHPQEILLRLLRISQKNSAQDTDQDMYSHVSARRQDYILRQAVLSQRKFDLYRKYWDCPINSCGAWIL